LIKNSHLGRLNPGLAVKNKGLKGVLQQSSCFIGQLEQQNVIARNRHLELAEISAISSAQSPALCSDFIVVLSQPAQIAASAITF
jgi:hypothetical protein